MSFFCQLIQAAKLSDEWGPPHRRRPSTPSPVAGQDRTCWPSTYTSTLEAKFGQHPPLNRQSEACALQGVDLSVSTIAGWAGACTANLESLVALIDAHGLAAERLHGDDTTVPVLAKGKTITGRMDLRARRPALWRPGTAGSDVQLLA